MMRYLFLYPKANLRLTSRYVWMTFSLLREETHCAQSGLLWLQHSHIIEAVMRLIKTTVMLKM